MIPNYYYHHNGNLTVTNADSAHNTLTSMTSGTVGVDVETVSLEDDRPIGIGFALTPTQSLYYPVSSPDLPKHILRNPQIIKIFHNGSFDLATFKHIGVSVPISSVRDTIIAASLLGNDRPSLADLSAKYLNRKWISIKDLLGKGKNKLPDMRSVPEIAVAIKCCNDCECTLALWNLFKSDVNPKAFDLEMRVMPTFLAIEEQGLALDVSKLVTYHSNTSQHLDAVKLLCTQLGFNPGSGKQVGDILVSRGFDVAVKKSTGNYILDSTTLKENYPQSDLIIRLVMEFKRLQTSFTHFLDPILHKHSNQGRIHWRIRQTGAATGRLSSSPNLQNIPAALRDIFIPDPGFLAWVVDLSQIELRVLAYLMKVKVGDSSMADVFDSGGDIHQATMDKTGLSRPVSKTLNFGVVYGAMARTISFQTGLPLSTSKSALDSIYKAYPGIMKLKHAIWEDIKSKGYAETMYGNRRYIPKMFNRAKWIRESGEREGFNTVIQGSAAEILKELQYKGRDFIQNNTIHDEIWFMLKFGSSPDLSINENIAPFQTPMSVKYGLDYHNLLDVTKYI